MFGSHLFWNDLLANGWVDELHFMIGAGVVGEGVRAFEHDDEEIRPRVLSRIAKRRGLRPEDL